MVLDNTDWVIRRLAELQETACKCGCISDDFEHHDKYCPYYILGEAMKLIDDLEELYLNNVSG